MDLDANKAKLLSDTFNEAILKNSEFNSEYVDRCLRSRLAVKSPCTVDVLEDFLKELYGTFESDVFVVSQASANLAIEATRKLTLVCGESEERAKYRFSFVLVDCNPI